MQVAPLEGSVEPLRKQPIFEKKSGAFLSFHVHETAKSHFFSTLSPWTICRGCFRGIVSVLTSQLFSAVDALYDACYQVALRVYALSLSFFYRTIKTDAVLQCTTRVLDFCIKDIGYKEKIENLRNQLYIKNSTRLYEDFEKTAVLTVVSGVKNEVMNACKTAPELNPVWIEKSIVTENELRERVYTFKGRVARLFIERNEAIISKALSLHLLKILSNLSDRLQGVQSENPYALLDLLRVCLEKVPPHFIACKQSEEAGMPETMIQKREKLQFFSELSHAICEVLFPEGEKEFELPVNKIVGSYISAFLFTKFKLKILPDLIESAFCALFDPDMKNEALKNLFMEVHQAIDHPQELDFDEQQVKILYPHLDALSELLGNCIGGFLNYLDPTVLPWILQNVAPVRLGQIVAKLLVMKFELITLQDLLLLALEKALPVLSPDGYWQEIEEEMRFFPVASDCVKRELPRVKQKVTTEELTRLVSVTGKDLAGIIKVIQKVIFNPTVTSSTDPEEQVGIVNTVVGFARTVYSKTTENMVMGGLWMTDVSGRIQQINTALLQKLPRPEHECIVYEVLKAGTQFLGC